MQLLFSEQRPHPRELAKSSRNLAEKLHRWYTSLPAELRYSKSMPVGLFEFQYESLHAARRLQNLADALTVPSVTAFRCI